MKRTMTKITKINREQLREQLRFIFDRISAPHHRMFFSAPKMFIYGYYLYKKRKAYDRFYAKLTDDIFSVDQYWYVRRNKKHYTNLSEEGQLNFLHVFFTDEHSAQKYKNLVYEYLKEKMLNGSDKYPEYEAYKEMGDSAFSCVPTAKACTSVKLPIVNKVALSHAFS